MSVIITRCFCQHNHQLHKEPHFGCISSRTTRSPNPHHNTTATAAYKIAIFRSYAKRNNYGITIMFACRSVVGVWLAPLVLRSIQGNLCPAERLDSKNDIIQCSYATNWIAMQVSDKQPSWDCTGVKMAEVVERFWIDWWIIKTIGAKYHQAWMQAPSPHGKPCMLGFCFFRRICKIYHASSFSLF